MKKKLPIPLLILAAVLLFFVILSKTAYILPFDIISLFSASAVEPPVNEYGIITVMKEGAHGGFGADRVTAEEGQAYRELFAALRAHRYKALPGSSIPTADGVAIFVWTDYHPVCRFYWDGSVLWLPTHKGGWAGYSPDSPRLLDGKLNTIGNL